jgi:hypothetical protein
MGMVIGDGYILGSAVMKGGMATIRHAATPTTEQVVIKFTGKSIHYERELAALRTIQSIEGEISCKNIINYQDYYTPDDLDDHIPFYLIVLEKGTASLQASLGNNRPLPCDDFKPILKVGSSYVFLVLALCIYTFSSHSSHLKGHHWGS